MSSDGNRRQPAASLAHRMTASQIPILRWTDRSAAASITLADVSIVSKASDQPRIAARAVPRSQPALLTRTRNNSPKVCSEYHYVTQETFSCHEPISRICRKASRGHCCISISPSRCSQFCSGQINTGLRNAELRRGRWSQVEFHESGVSRRQS